MASKPIKLGILTFAIMNMTTVISTRALAPEAEYGLTAIFYYLFAAVCFLIPVALVAAELATGWPQKGGVFNWIGRAFGHRFGFLAIWLQWLATTICFPTMLIFLAVAVSYVFPHHHDLAQNKLYILFMVLGVYWFSTFTTSFGVKSAARISAVAGIIGTIIPLIVLIGFGGAFLLQGHSVAFSTKTSALLPDFHQFHSLVLAASVFLFYSGMEINAVHVSEMENAEKHYPMAIGLASLFTVVLLILGTLTISAVIPKSHLNLVSSLLVTFDDIFAFYHVSWLGNVLAGALAIGVFGQVTVIVAGPSTGLYQVGKVGYLPRIFQKANKYGVQMPILYLQGGIVTVLALLLIVLPSVQSAFQILGQLAGILYLSMYLMLFAAAISLRYLQPDVVRPYQVPFGKIGIWLVGGLGFCASLLAWGLSFIPPTQIAIGSGMTYSVILIGLTILFVVIPLGIYQHQNSVLLK